MISGHQLRRDVLDELNFEPRVNAAHIGVGAEDGVVPLSGFVASYAEKSAAEVASRRVKGRPEGRAAERWLQAEAEAATEEKGLELEIVLESEGVV